MTARRVYACFCWRRRVGVSWVLQHAWFGHNGWQLHAVPPIQPPLQHAGDTSNFETFADIPLKQSGVDEHAGLFLDF